MNPYKSTESSEVIQPDAAQQEPECVGPRCPSCGSANTSKDAVLRSSPNILAVMLFGWIVMLIRGAFAMRSSVCRDCGETNKYKSVGSWIALVILIMFAGLIAMGFVIEPG